MKLIAHRGLVEGANADLENDPAHLGQVLASGLDAEVDVWYQDKTWWLGHDAPSHQVDLVFLNNPQLWLHAKNFDAANELISLSRVGYNHNFFWHENDQRTLTSWGFWWTYPNEQLGRNSVAVMPEWHTPLQDLSKLLSWNCHGICSDWISKLK